MSEVGFVCCQRRDEIGVFLSPRKEWGTWIFWMGLIVSSEKGWLCCLCSLVWGEKVCWCKGAEWCLKMWVIMLPRWIGGGERAIRHKGGGKWMSWRVWWKVLTEKVIFFIPSIIKKIFLMCFEKTLSHRLHLSWANWTSFLMSGEHEKRFQRSY